MRKRKRKKKRKSANQIPGKMVYVGKKSHSGTSFDIFTYNRSLQNRLQTDDPQEVIHHQLRDDETAWIHVKGLHRVDIIKKLGNRFGLHPLLLEDVVNTEQRPKFEEYEDYIFVVLKMYYTEKETYVSEHVSLVMGPNYLLTFSESGPDVFAGVRKRLINDLGLVRKAKSDFLMYALIDAIIDNYFVITETMGRQIEDLEDYIFLGNADDDIIMDIQSLKREIMQLRRDITPIRDMTGRLEKSDTPLIAVKTYNYLRDLHDHGIQISEAIEIYREMAWGLMDMYMSTINNKMNEVMKVLTIMASIFIPLTFLAGVYGMNFDNMPELHWKYGYLSVWIIMGLILVSLIWYFKRKRWF